MNPSNSVQNISFLRRIKYLTEYIFLLIFVQFFKILPRKMALFIGRKLGLAVYFLLPSRFRIAEKNLKGCFPDITAARVREIISGCWKNIGSGFGEFVQLPQMSKSEIVSLVECEGLEHLRNSYQAGKGAVLLTAHYGAWELGGKYWTYAGFKTAVIARRVKNPYVNEFVTDIRNSHDVKMILARSAVRESIRWLKEGNLLALLVDHRITEGGLQVPFFGRPAFTTSLPAILALRYSVPIHPAHGWREGEKVKIQIDSAMDFSGLEPNEEGIYQALLRMNKIVEEWIKKRPENWLWIHNRWKGS